MTRDEMAAAAEVFKLIEQVVGSMSHYNDQAIERIERAVIVRSALISMAISMEVCSKFPDDLGMPLKDFREVAEQIRSGLAKLAEPPGLDYRDTRDLLMEFGADGITAGQMASGRAGSPGDGPA